MRVLVTGASGFVGPYLLQRLRADGHEVVATSSDGLPPPAWESDAGVVWRRLDVRDGASIEATLGDVQPEAIVHLAAVSSVARSWTDPEGTWDVNASGTHRLARWAATLCPGRRFLFVSSSEVYGASVAPDRPVAEDAPLRPLNPYGASKAAAELALEPWRVAGRLDVVIARSFGHSGPGQSPEFVLANVALQLARIRRGQQPPRLRVGNLDVRRELLDVRDVVDAYALLLERGAERHLQRVPRRGVSTTRRSSAHGRPGRRGGGMGARSRSLSAGRRPLRGGRPRASAGPRLAAPARARRHVARAGGVGAYG